MAQKSSTDGTTSRALFTPMKIARGSKTAVAVGRCRVTIGELANGQKFIAVDEWKITDNQHELLAQPWAGTTYFTESLAVPRIFASAQLPQGRAKEARA